MDDDGFLQIIRSLTEEDTNIFNDLLNSPKILSTCEICNKNFSNKNNLKLHIKLHSGKKPFSCKDCERKFSTKRGLKSHRVSCLKPENQKLKFSPKIFGCKICKKKFVSKVNLTLHSKSHNNQYIYNCQTCGKGLIETIILRFILELIQKKNLLVALCVPRNIAVINPYKFIYLLNTDF